MNPLHDTASRRAWITALAALAVAPGAAWAAGAESTAPQVRFVTSLGDFTVELYPAKAPETVKNFLQYVKDKHYDGTVFHRVIDGFMIQGGGFNAEMQQKSTRAPIVLESKNGLKNERGTLAMARTGIPDSATAQFFINVVDNGNLDAPRPDGHGYAVFGKVIAGMDVIDKIRAVPVGNRGMHQNVPTMAVVIRSATQIK
jgi:peptidyl-prolyl cis-trans isomerase A (cyclophilin A)